MKVRIMSSIEYAMAVEKWSEVFTELMGGSNNAAVAVLAYYLPGKSDFMTCPLCVSAIKKLGTMMRDDEAMFAAAEDTGLLAEAVAELFRMALDNHGNWCALDEDIKYMLENAQFRRFIPFKYRFCAEKIMTENELLCKDEDLWDKFTNELERKLNERKLIGY